MIYGKHFCNVPWLLLAGAIAGLCNGLLGVGGGIAIVYALSAFEGDEGEEDGRRDIFATAVASILPISAVSAFFYVGSGIEAAGVEQYILPAVTGGIVGAFFLDKMKPRLTSKLFSLLVMWAGASMILRRAGIL